MYISVKGASLWHDEEVPAEKLTPERRRKLTRDALMDAAEVVFVKKGFGEASMEEIAAEAGFSRGAIYSNFGTKHELLLAVLDRFISRQFAQFEAPAAEDAVVAARDAARVFSRSVSLELLPLEFELRLNALRHPAARERLVDADRRVSERSASLVEAMLAGRGQLTVPARDIADIGRAAVAGLLQLAATDPEQADRYVQLVETLFVLLTAAVTGSSPNPSPGRAAKVRKR
jgi:AcrR family transcriptional regulator